MSNCYWNCLDTCLYYKPHCLLLSYDQTMTVRLQKSNWFFYISFSFYIETYHLFSISLFLCRSKYSFWFKLFLHGRFLSPGTKTSNFFTVFFLSSVSLKKMYLNTENNGKTDILVDHEFHIVSLLSRSDVSVAMYMYIT